MSNKKVVTLIGIISAVLIGLIINLEYNLNNPTEFNKIIALKKNAPANKAFDDQNFYNCVIDAYNEENKTSLSYTTNLTTEQLKTIKEVSCYGYEKEDSEKITSTKGLELMPKLKWLNVDDNQLTSIDVSNNPNLVRLYAKENQLTSIDVSHNLNLETLWVSENQITKLDVSHNPKLEILWADYNQLTNLDLSHNLNLESLNVSNNNLTSIDVSHNLNLEILWVSNKQLTNIDVSHNPNLKNLKVSDSQVTSIDVSHNPNLEHLYAYNIQLTSIDVSHNPNLVELSVGDNQLTSIDVSHNPNLEILWVSNKQLTNIDVSHNPNLTNLKVSDSQVTSIDVSHNPNLKELSIDENQLTSLDVSNNLNLKKLNAHDNELSNINLNGATSLTSANLNNNKLTSLNLGSYKNELNIYGDNNPLTNIKVNSDVLQNVIKGDTLTFKYDNNGKVNFIDTSEINKIELNTSNLKSIELNDETNNSNLGIDLYNSKNVNLLMNNTNVVKVFNDNNNLTGVYNNNNKLTINSLTSIGSLNLNTPNVETIELDGTNEKQGNITSIDVSHNSNLKKLSAKYNKLSKMDLRGNARLTEVDLSNNDISSLILGGFSNDSNINILNNPTMNLSINSNYLLSTSKDNDNLVLNYSKNTVKLNELSKIEKINFNTPNLKTIELDGTNEKQGNIKSIDVSKCSSLTKLSTKYNKIEEINLSKNTKLEQLFLSNNNLNSINVENNTELTYLNISNNNLKSLDISKNNKITTLYTGNNDFSINKNVKKGEEIDFSKVDSDIFKVNNKIKKTYDGTYNGDEKIDDKITISDMGVYNYKIKYNLDGIKTDGLSINYNLILLDISSKKYPIVENNIIVSGDDTDEMILNNVEIPKQYTKKLEENKINIYKEDKIIQGYNILRIKTKKYEIDYKEETIKVDSDEDNEILNNIEVENAEKVIENNYLIIRKENKNLIKFKLYGIETEYKINYEKNIIYTKNDINIEEKIKLRNLEEEIEDNELKLKDGEKEIYSLKILSISTKEYIVGEGYIYIGAEKLDLNEIETELNKEEKENKIELTYEGEVIDTLEIISLKTNEYEIGKNYIYSENNTINTKEIECTNCTMSINNNILEIYNKEKIVKRLERIYVDFKEIKIRNNNIEISEGMTYETLKNNVVLNGVNIKIYDEEDKEITIGEIKEGYTLKVISEKYGEIKEYIFTKEYIDITELEIEEEKYITKFNIGVTNKEIKEKIKTTGSVKIEDKNGHELEDSDIIKTGTKVVIEIGKEKQEYTIVVKGDVTGTGQIAMPDVMKAVNYMLNDNNNEDEECYKKAADVTSDGKILMNDVMKIVNYMFEGE